MLGFQHMNLWGAQFSPNRIFLKVLRQNNFRITGVSFSHSGSHEECESKALVSVSICCVTNNYKNISGFNIQHLFITHETQTF